MLQRRFTKSHLCTRPNESWMQRRKVRNIHNRIVEEEEEEAEKLERLFDIYFFSSLLSVAWAGVRCCVLCARTWNANDMNRREIV